MLSSERFPWWEGSSDEITFNVSLFCNKSEKLPTLLRLLISNVQRPRLSSCQLRRRLRCLHKNVISLSGPSRWCPGSPPITRIVPMMDRKPLPLLQLDREMLKYFVICPHGFLSEWVFRPQHLANEQSISGCSYCSRTGYDSSHMGSCHMWLGLTTIPKSDRNDLHFWGPLLSCPHALWPSFKENCADCIERLLRLSYTNLRQFYATHPPLGVESEKQICSLWRRYIFWRQKF